MYRALDGAGALTAAELAERTGLHERWLVAWLSGNAAADLLDSPDGVVFELTPARAAVLSREEERIAFAAGAFSAPLDPAVVDDLATGFRVVTGPSHNSGRAARAGLNACSAVGAAALVPRRTVNVCLTIRTARLCARFSPSA